MSRANSAQSESIDLATDEIAHDDAAVDPNPPVALSELVSDLIRGAVPAPVPVRLPFPLPAIAAPTLVTARVHGMEGERVRLAIGRQVVLATRDPGLHPVVLAGAAARGERVLAERAEDGAWTVVGALRTQPTPGLEVADEYTIEAGRVTIRGKHEVSLVAEAAGLAVRAVGEVESYAERIVSRAEGLHKIVGRILKIN